MNKYMKRFVMASLVYMAMAAGLGVWNGVGDPGYWAVFGHTHFNLLGFMSMMVFGIGYFILPRFNGVELRFPGWVPVHFWLANISLLGMVVFRGLGAEYDAPVIDILFAVSATTQVISIFMFVVNLWLTLSTTGGEAAKPDAKNSPANETTVPTATGISLSPETKISDLVDADSSLLNTLIEAGLTPLAMPGHIDRVKNMGVTIGMACQSHNIDVTFLIRQIANALTVKKIAHSIDSDQCPAPTVTPDTLIGEVIENYPQTRPIFQASFGSGCFDCPGQSYESIEMACRMHGVDPQQFITSLNESLSR